MVIIENAIFHEVKKCLWPGSVLLDVSSFRDGANFLKVTLYLARDVKNNKWGVPVYLILVGIPHDDTISWALNPWLSDACINHLSTLIPPALLFSRVSDSDNQILVAKSAELWPVPIAEK